MFVLFAASALVQLGGDTLRLRKLEVVPAESMAVHEAGAGPPVVIVPGLLGSAYGFRKVTASLIEDGYRVLVVDPLGTGSSSSPSRADYSLTAQAERIAAAARALNVQDAVFVCHSTGASICFRIALQHPDLVAGLVSINGGPAERMRTPGLGLALKIAPLLKLFGGAKIARGKVKDGLIDSSADPTWVTAEVVAGYTAHYRGGIGPVLSTLKRMSAATEPAPLAPELPAITNPVHLLVGEHVRMGAVRPDEMDALRSIPGLTVDSISDVGQYIHEEQPDIVIAAVVDMVRRTVALDRGATR